MAATTTAAMVAVATMIDPLLPNGAAARLEALRSQAPKRRKPAYSAKIFTAGASTTAMLGLIAAMGWPTGTSVAEGAAPVAPLTPDVTLPVAPVVSLPPVLPAPTTAAPVVTVAPLIVAPAPAVVTEPPATLPAPVPATAAPVVIPVVVPVAQTQVKKKKRIVVAVSNTTTKSSG